MKKLMIAIILATVAAAPAHAINAKYREQLERSGCNEMNAGQGCDIHKTKAQNAAEAKKSQNFSKFAGTYSVFLRNGQRIGNKIIVVKPHEVRYNGHLAERPRIVNGVLLFSVQEAQFSITSTHGNELGTWFNDANDTGGTIGR